MRNMPPYVITRDYSWPAGETQVGNVFITNVSGDLLSIIGENPLENYYSLDFIDGDILIFKNSNGFNMFVQIISSQYALLNAETAEFEYPMINDILIPNGTAFEFRPTTRDAYGEFNFS